MSSISSDIRQFFRQHIFVFSCIVGAVFVGMSGISAFYFHAHPEIARELLDAFMESKSHLLSEDNQINVVPLFMNNLRVTFLFLVTGFIAPLSIFLLIINASSVGAVLAVSEEYSGLSVGKTIVFGLLPHGFFELSAFFIAAALGLYVGTYWMRKNKKYTGKTLVAYTLGIFLAVCVPFLICAALIEAYVTPHLIQWVM